MQQRRAQRTIGVLAPWMGGDFLGNILVAIHEVAQRHDMRVVVTCTAIQTTGERVLSHRNLLSRPTGAGYIDGWVLVGDALAPEDMQALTADGKPAVGVSGGSGNEQHPLIISDNYGGTRDGVLHLLDHGHTRIAFVGSMHMADMQERYRGYRDAHAERGIPLDPALLRETELPWPEFGRQAGQALVEEGLPCTAIVCGNDELAFGIMPTLVAAGYHVPDDVAMLGFDDREEAQYQDPPLSSIRQNAYGLGVRAMELLLLRLAGEAPGYGPHRVATALVRRRSCGWDVLDQLQGDTQLASLPVIICSVQDLAEDEINVLPNLCLYLQKPVRQEDLLALIGQLTPPSSVLIVDDDPDARHVLRRLLQDMDIDVVEATNGAEALALIETQRPELILLDLMMPVMDGFAVLEHLQDQPDLAELPVIAITAQDLSREEQQWLGERTRSCVQKPVSSSQFLALIRRLVPEARP